MGGGGGGGQSSTMMRDPAILGLAQRGYASGALSPQQNFNLHPDTMDPTTYGAMNFGNTLNQNHNFQSSNDAYGFWNDGNNVNAAFQPSENYYNQVMNGQYMGQLPGAFQGYYDQATQPLFGSDAYGAQSNLIDNGQLNGAGGDFLSGMASGHMSGPAGDYLTQLMQGHLSGPAGDYYKSMIGGQGPGGAAGQYLNDEVGGKYVGQGNPYINDVINQSIQSARPGMDAAFAANGRTGSGVAANAFADSANRISSQMHYQDYSNERANQQNAAQLLAQLQQGAAGQFGALQSGAANTFSGLQSGAASTLAGLQAGAIQNRLGMLQGLSQQQLAALEQQYGAERGQQLASAQGQSQNAQARISDQLGAAGGLSQNLRQEMEARMAASSLQQNFDLGNMQDQANQFNYDQSRPGMALMNFMQMLSGANSGSQVQNTGGSGLLQNVGAGIGVAGSLAGIGVAI